MTNRNSLGRAHVFAMASAVLERRWQRLATDGPDWLCSAAVRSIAMPLITDGSPVLVVALKDGVSGRDIPSNLWGIPLRAVRQSPLQMQSNPPGLTLRRTQAAGTATVLVRDRLNGERSYLLTCGHVAAPDAAARYGDELRVALPGGVVVDAFLREWQPAIGDGRPLTTLDAALVEVDAGTLQSLTAQGSNWLPRRVSDDIRAGLPIALQRMNGPLEGMVCERWSGEVGGGPGEAADYLLREAIGYRTPELTIGGDSGAPIWSEGDALVGMHVGAIDTPRINGANAVMARVKPALDWYCVKPYTRDDPATLTAEDWPARPVDGPLSAAAAAAGSEDLEILAKTLWGEARGEGRTGMEAVAAVVLNRLSKRYRGCDSIAEVCLDPKQFSCWNANDPNLPLLERIDWRPDEAYEMARSVATLALSGQLNDPTRGARHYVARSLPLALRPKWLDQKSPCAVIGRHEFYNDIR